jgi:hypothetical protein
LETTKNKLRKNSLVRKHHTKLDAFLIRKQCGLEIFFVFKLKQKKMHRTPLLTVAENFATTQFF